MAKAEKSGLIFFPRCCLFDECVWDLSRNSHPHLFQIHRSLCDHVIGGNTRALSQRIRRCSRLQRRKIPLPSEPHSYVLVQAACTNVMKLIRSSNDLSRSSDHDFLMSFAPLRRRMDTIAEKILQRYTSVDCEPSNDAFPYELARMPYSSIRIFAAISVSSHGKKLITTTK